MSQGIIFSWRKGDKAGRIHVTNDVVHKGDDAAFGLSACSLALQSFLADNDITEDEPLIVTFDLFTQNGNLRASNIA